MINNELDRFEQLKKEAIENPGKKLKGCKSCKKKAEVTVTSPQLIVEEPIPAKEQLIEAYELMKANANSEKDLTKIYKIFEYVMGYNYRKACGGCGNKEFIKFQHKLRSEFKLDV